MRRFIQLLVAVMLLSTSPAFALFNNGGFETGDFSGWTLDYGDRNYGYSITWGQADHGLYAVIDNTATMPGQTLDIDPYNGTYMARINDSAGGYHATKISQTDTISQQDIDDGATVYVNWGAALVEPTNYDHYANRPYFGVTVTVGSDVQSFTADAAAHSSDPTWTLAGSSPPGWDAGDLWYKCDSWSYDISSYSIGTSVTVEMFVADCSESGHGGYAFLDGIGTTYQPPNVIPAPGAILLGTIGAGLVGWLRRRRTLQ